MIPSFHEATKHRQCDKIPNECLIGTVAASHPHHIDAYLGRVSCAPKKYSVRLPLDHEDTKSLQSDPKVQAINKAELNEAQKVAEANGFPSPTGTSSYSVHVDEDCKLQLVD